MDLETIARRVFEDDYLRCNTSKIDCKNSKKIFLMEVREWLETFFNELKDQGSQTTGTTESDSSHNDTREGRIGSPTAYFTLDRSFGIVAINQEGLSVVAACRFASIAASCGVFSGKWMYELHLGSKGIMQIGWCSNSCRFTIDRGCGDTLHSYAFDGSRIKAWNMISKNYGEQWKTGDIIGLCIDLDAGKIEFYRNGRPLGTAFRDVVTGLEMMYIPCVSLVEGESVYANFGARPFKYPVEGYEPLQQVPHAKIKEAVYLFKWIKNLTDIVVPSQPAVLNCNDKNDISDSVFWNRLYGALYYHLNTVLGNRYCLFHNFLPFIKDIANLNSDKENTDLSKFNKVMDQCWMFIKERCMDKTLFFIISDFTSLFRQVSDTLNCPNKRSILSITWALLSHEATRKYLIQNLMFERFDIFVFLHHKPLDDAALEQFTGNSWWDTSGLDPEVDKHKKSFKTAFEKIEKIYEGLEKLQISLLSLIMTNTDGAEDMPSSRRLFLKKFRKFVWHELDCARNDLNSRVPTSVAYASFLRFLRILNDLWQEEIFNEPLVVPTQYFYDRTLQYSSCDRIGGLEQYLVHVYHTELTGELGENHRLFTPSSVEAQSTTVPFAEIRPLGGVNEIFSMFEENSNENVLENLLLPSSSNGPLLQAIFTPLLKDAYVDIANGNIDSRISLYEFFEDLLIFFTSTVAKHCRKISKTHEVFEQAISDYKAMHSSFVKLSKTRAADDPILLSLERTLELQKADLEKKARKNAWIQHVLLNPSRFDLLITMYDSLISTVTESETHGELFVFLPDFYLEACDTFVNVLAKDFAAIQPVTSLPEGERNTYRMAELMIRIMGDRRIKHVDCKKLAINTLATLASNESSMNVLESVDKERAKEFVEKLMASYTDRHWKATNWTLVRFWHGCGYGFRYTSLPHHNIASNNLINPNNYVMYNIASGPSVFYQTLVRDQLLDTTASIPVLLDSIISELHWTFGEFLAPMQELQRAIERNEQLLMFGRLYKMCSSYFDKTIALLRVLDMFISLAPEVFLESYYPESTSLTIRIIQIVLLIIHRISSKQGCFRTVMNSRIAVLENVDYLPIETACVAILLDILGPELENFDEDDLVIPLFSRILLSDSSYDAENLKNLIGSPENKNSTVVSLHDYEGELVESELLAARRLVKMLSTFLPMMSSVKVIPEEELCTICYNAPFDVKFVPCGHNSCLSCISYYITKNRACFFCKRPIIKVLRIEDDSVIEALTTKEVTAASAT